MFGGGGFGGGFGGGLGGGLIVFVPLTFWTSLPPPVGPGRLAALLANG